MTISLCCLSGGDPARLAALLALCRDAVDEIVIALDDRVDPGRAGQVAELADSVVRIPYAPPMERTLPWLYARCRGDWILRLDDDEVPGRALLEGVRELVGATWTHVWLPRRWLWGAPDTYLAAHPWQPDFQLRLSVSDRRLLRFPGLTHVGLAVDGPGRYVEAPIYHAELLRPREEREAKAAAYERARPGMRISGLAFNQAIYLPELGDASLAPLPPDDAALVEHVLATDPASEGPAPDLPRATRGEIDALWPLRELDTAAELRVRHAPGRLESGERAQIVVSVRNSGPDVLEPSSVQIGSRWDGGEPGLWSRLPGPVPPGDEAITPATIEAPVDAGRHVVELDLVQEGVRWLGAPVQVAVEVAPRRRVGILVRDATLERAGRLAETVSRQAPRLEPLVLGVADAGGYATDPGPEPELTAGLAAGVRKLRSFLVAGWRARELRRRGGPALDGLVLAGLDATTLLERWIDLAAAAQAADRGAPVLVPRPPEPRGTLDRLLLVRLLRLPGVTAAAGPLEDALPPFLHVIERQRGLS